MLQRLNKILYSIEISIFPPSFRRSPSTSIRLSERLELTTFFGRSGHPRLYVLNKVHGRADRLFGADTGPHISFSPFEPALRDILDIEAQSTGVEIGKYMWRWVLEKDTLMLLVMDEWSFYIKLDEAKSLEQAIFGYVN